MTRTTMRKVALLILLTVILGWLVYRKTSSPQPTETGIAIRGQAAATEPQAADSTRFEVTSSRPLPGDGTPPADSVVAMARRHFQEEGTEGRCGPYRLLADIGDDRLLDVCRKIGAELDPAYSDRFGVQPIGEPAAIILLFGQAAGYRDFAAEAGMTSAGYAGFSLPARGFTAAWADPARPADFAQTLAHELTHLVNRRALGGGLPRWLSEGLADAIGDTATLEGIQPLRGLSGAEGVAQRLQLGLESNQVGSLAQLVTGNDDDFDAASPSYDYEQSALLVRFLLLDSDLAPGFRAFLDDLATGADYSAERLRVGLGTDWAELDRRFASWLRSTPAS